MTIAYDSALRPVGIYPRRNIEHTEAWLACPCPKHLTAIREAVAESRTGEQFVPSWALLDGCFTPVRGQVSREGVTAVVFFAAAQAGAACARESVCASLIRWALGTP